MNLSKTVEYINYIFIGCFLLQIFFKIWIYPSTDMSIGLSAFVSIVMMLFMVPYLLSSRSLRYLNKSNKSKIWVMAAWPIFIIIGMLSPEQSTFVILCFTGLLALNAINVIALIKQPLTALA